MTIGYKLGIPEGPDNPSNDQPDMKINNDNIAKFVAIDHIPFGVANSGYHTVIHQKPYLNNTWNPAAPGGTPPAIAGVEQVFSMNYTPNYPAAPTDTQLFSKTGGGGISQLTGQFGSAQGWCWTSGILLMWGQITPAGTSGTVNFYDGALRPAGIPFPNNIFTIHLEVAPIPALTSITAISTTAFSWKTSIIETIIYWFAVGN